MSDLRGDLTQVVVAEDLFTLCEPEMELGESERVRDDITSSWAQCNV